MGDTRCETGGLGERSLPLSSRAEEIPDSLMLGLRADMLAYLRTTIPGNAGMRVDHLLLGSISTLQCFSPLRPGEIITVNSKGS